MTTAVLRITADRPQHACRIIEHIINPALRDYGIVVSWPDLTEPEVSISYDATDLRDAFAVRDNSP
jgi:hypothetical protein